MEVDKGLEERLKRGLEIKLKNFGEEVVFFSPGFKHYEVEDFYVRSYPKFVDISITGRSCELMCEHCASKILWHMIPATTPEELFKVAKSLKEKGIEGILISGGSDKEGFVRLEPFLETIRKIKEELNLTVNCHVGLVDEELSKGLKEAKVDAVLIDIIGDDETIREVYHLKNKGVEDYEKSLYYLQEFGHNIVPHVIIGLHFGKIKGERRAIDLISKFKVKALVLVVIMPYFGKARFQLLPPPKPSECAEIILYAREKLPKVPISLGCARPAGEDRFLLDYYSLLAGVNAITFPAEGIFTLTKKLGLKPIISQSCCSSVYYF